MHTPQVELSLEFEGRHKIVKKGLREPSGLTVAADSDVPALWTVCDETKKIFRLVWKKNKQKWRVDPTSSFEVEEKNLEGITQGADPDTLYAVQEKEENVILKYSVSGAHPPARRELRQMANYDKVKAHFKSKKQNAKNGLEGICFNTNTGSLLLLKERNPGLLIEVSPELDTLKGEPLELSEANGFFWPGRAREKHKMDYSGLAYHPGRDGLWVISDSAEWLYFYSFEKRAVIADHALSYPANGHTAWIDKAEGVAFDAKRSKLYVVSDAKGCLFVFRVEMGA